MADEWQRWVVENLLRGVEPHELVTGLVEGGAPRGLAERTVFEIVRSPGFVTARDRDHWAKRLAQVARLLSTVGKPSPLERRPAPDAFELFGRYWATSTPAVFTDIVSRWRTQWTPQSLRERFGGAKIEACVGREGDPRPDVNWRAHRRQLTLAEYVDRMLAVDQGNDLYLIANNRNTARGELRALWDDVVLPSGWFDAQRLPHGSALWLGPAGTVTPLHHDTSNILFCQVHGRKRVVLAPPWTEALLRKAEGVYSRMDVQQVLDDDDIVSFDLTLRPGESLFIPAGWWHDVRALDASVSLAINAFVRPNSFGWYTPGGVR
ncbi:cupin-like domain-containing protein [Paraliomyxa miuraensis]|uniref:cupin-like domain-containing protein n=1 Tax=Paraliomyxa miuraensis TaxID=376150 RepID=UPI002256C029|nr:cupin-like domain-containing protein [Paraliomyxa miuraensis]MCX4244113.1 cupin-like domain-containing protein [Paraliomyxa miuraensis]